MLPYDQILPPDQQFGFWRNLSPVQQAANFHVTAAPSKRWTTVVSLLDVEKAYDRVWRQGLLLKLRILQISLRIRKFFLGMVIGQNFSSLYQDDSFNRKAALKRLPQGFSLLPILFNLFLGNLPNFTK